MTDDLSSKNAAVLVNRATSAYNASNFDQTIEHCRAALILLGGLDDETAHALLDEAYERLTMTYQRLGDFAAARRVIDEWRERTYRVEGHVQNAIQESRVYSYIGHYDEAQKSIENALTMAETADYRSGIGMAKRIQADIQWKMGYTEKALVLSQQALSILEQTGDLEQQAATHVSIAAAYHHGGKFYKSIQHLQRAARIVEQLGRQFELAIIYSNLGETYAELYAMNKALEAHQKAILLVGEHAHPDLLRNLGVDLISVDRRDEGLAYLHRALQRARETNNPDMIAQALFSLAENDLQIGKLDQAQERSDELLQLATRLDSLRHRVRALMLLGEIARQRGDQTTARAHFHDCSMLAQQSDDHQAIWQIHAILYELMRETLPKMADVHRRIAAEMMNHILNGIEDPELSQTFRSAEPVRVVLEKKT
ncbi:MAG: tetratricopeptide repeat protein [Chloroflexi bacterium]|nr:tetratricopeptide repeat protein [Chloroflexota bacterium]